MRVKIIKLFRNKLTWIFILALILRIYKLGDYPVGFHIDEVKVGWNALSIWKTGLDDHRNFLSLYYNSFGDFRPSGIFYLTIPSIILFGNNIFAVRFASALFGALTVIPIYYLSLEISKNKKLSHIASFLLGISTWHIEVSRATSEVVISTFFATASIYYLIKTLKTSKTKYFYLSSSTILISYLLYHAIRFLAPPFFITTLLIYFKQINRKSVYLLIIVVVLSAFLSTTKEGLQRFDQVSILKSIDLNYQIDRTNKEDVNKSRLSTFLDNKYVIYSRYFVVQYSDYFSGGFLLGQDARPYRYTTPGVGLLNYFEILFLVLGIIEIVRKKYNYLPIFLLLIAPLPAALTIEDSPNLHRALFMIPFMIMIEAFGFYKLIKHRRILFLGMFLSTVFFLHMYFTHSNSHRPYIKDFFVDSPTYRDVGMVELVNKLKQYSNDYDKIIVTNFPDNPYPYFAFLTNQNPQIFNLTYNKSTNQRDFGKITFSEQKCPTDIPLNNYQGKKILFVDNWECGYASQIKAGLNVRVVDKITREDNSEVYIFLTNN